MRYYCPFPDTIPLWRAGCSRVTHPSATQSYQNSFRRNHSSSFVRLACVRHAASVRPEPGSNSLKYCINTSFDVPTYFRVYRLIFDTDVSLIPLTLTLIGITVEKYFFSQILIGFLFFSLFNFQGSIPLPLSRTAYWVYHIQLTLSTPFFNFFKVFPAFSKFCFCDIPFSQTLAPLPRRAFVYRILSLTLSLVNTFFDLFCSLFILSVHSAECFWVIYPFCILYLVPL